MYSQLPIVILCHFNTVDIMQHMVGSLHMTILKRKQSVLSYSAILTLRKPQETLTVKTSAQLSQAFSHPTKYFSNINDNIQQEIKCLLVCSVITDATFVLW